MIEKLEMRLNMAQQNKAHIKIMEVTLLINQQQKNDHLKANVG